jgi:FkbM family methyltransferase
MIGDSLRITCRPPPGGRGTVSSVTVEKGRIRVRDLSFRYSDLDDVLGLIESVVLDVYDSRRIAPGSTVVDVGAGIGDFAVVASRRVGPRGRVVAIEPNPEDFDCLVENARENRCTNVVAENVALGRGEGTMDLTFKGRTFRARVRGLSAVLREAGFVEGERVSVLKMDIEGGEREVIPDNLALISSCDSVAVEFHGGAHTELIPRVENLGFEFARFRRNVSVPRVAAFVLRHPIQGVRLYRLLKESRPSAGVGKLLHGIDISSSESLVVGVFTKRRTPRQPTPR